MIEYARSLIQRKTLSIHIKGHMGWAAIPYGNEKPTYFTKIWRGL